MTTRHAIAGALLVGGVGIQVLACAGVLVARDVLDRLHLVAPAAVLGGPLVCAAVLVDESFDAGGLHAILVAVVLLATGPVLTHATARAIHVRRRGTAAVLPSEAREAHDL